MQSALALENKRLALEAELQEEITLDGLAGEWRIYQRRRGHRYSTDDLLTAWYAMQWAPATVTQMLDLGTGIGSIGLSCAWHFTAAHYTGIEAQALSYRLLRENVWANGVSERSTIIQADLRDAAAGVGQRFELVTGSPPYFELKKAIPAADSQKAHARFELRGDVSDYCKAAKITLLPSGRFIFCFPTNQLARALRGVREAGLCVVRQRDVIPRTGIAPLFSLVCCAHELHEAIIEAPLHVRDARGARSEEMNRVRVDLNMPIKDRPTD